MSDTISRQAAIDAAALSAAEWDGMYVQDINGRIREALEKLPSAQPEIVRCKDCKHFEYDHIENVNGIPLIIAHEICMRWGEGAKTSENGYCFLAERKDNG